MTREIRLNLKGDDAVRELLHGPAARAAVDAFADELERAAEADAARISRFAGGGIARERGRDAQSVYADVGFDKTRRGWHLVFYEIGTSRLPAYAFLRNAAARLARTSGRGRFDRG